MSSPPCSCRLPWTLTGVAALIASGVVITSGTSPVPPSLGSTNPRSAAEAPSATAARLGTTMQELEETRRVLDVAQSALGQRDREIASANEDLRLLRQELADLKGKAVRNPP